MIVLDTNVVSELMRPSRDPAVVTWLDQQTRGSLVTTAITVAEIRFGLARLPDGRRATELRQLADEVFGSFPDQVLPFDAAAAALYGDIAAARERGGRPVDALDAQIAAIVARTPPRWRRATPGTSSAPASNSSTPGKPESLAVDVPSARREWTAVAIPDESAEGVFQCLVQASASKSPRASNTILSLAKSPAISGR